MNLRELMAKRAALLNEADAILKAALDAGRATTDEENAKVDEFEREAAALQGTIERAERVAQANADLTKSDRRVPAPAILKHGLGDNETKAVAHYARTGDRAALAGLMSEQESDFMAASNDTDMNVTTAADGGNLVPTGHFQGIVAKKSERALYPLLGVTPYNGLRGKTANVPIETGSANVFVATAESPGTTDRDAPVLDQAELTLVNFTKSIEITNDLMDMEDAGLMTFLENYVGRALAATHNNALVTEALANGTAVALGAAAAATAGDPETVTYALQAEYADQAAWVMARTTLGKYKKLTGNPFLYQPTPAGMNTPPMFAEFPILQSSFVPAVGAGNKSSIFGNFEYMGMRETPLAFLFDPYSSARTGRKWLHYYTRIVYKVTNADALLYGQHPTA